MTNSDGESATKGRRDGGGTGSLFPLPSPSSLSSLGGVNGMGDDKKMEATQSSRQRCPFIYSKTITLGSTCTLPQTTNLCFLKNEQEAGRSEEVNLLLHNTFEWFCLWKKKSNICHML